MSLIGTTDAAAFSQNIGVTNGDATVTKNAADTVVGGDVLQISGVNYIVKTITSTTSIELHKVYAGATATVTAANVINTRNLKYITTDNGVSSVLCYSGITVSDTNIL